MKPNNTSYVELHVPDFKLAKDFYGSLGFKMVWEHSPKGHEGYLVMKRGHNIIAFWAGNDEVFGHPHFKRYPKDTPRGYAVELVFMVDDLHDLYETAQASANIVEELHMQPWGQQDFRIEDPFGFYVRFTEPTDILIEDENSIK